MGQNSQKLVHCVLTHHDTVVEVATDFKLCRQSGDVDAACVFKRLCNSVRQRNGGRTTASREPNLSCAGTVIQDMKRHAQSVGNIFRLRTQQLRTPRRARPARITKTRPHRRWIACLGNGGSSVQDGEPATARRRSTALRITATARSISSTVVSRPVAIRSAAPACTSLRPSARRT